MQRNLMILLACLAPATTHARGQAQDPGEQEGPPLVSVGELSLEHYTPRYSRAKELYILADRMIGRQLFVRERGGYNANPVNNLSLLGDQIVLYDTGEYVKTLLGTLQALDLPGGEKEQAGTQPYVTSHYVPRYISLASAEQTISPLRRTLDDGHNNLGLVEERRTLVLRDTQARIDEMLKLLASIDLPEEQVLLRVFLLEGHPGDDEAGHAPAELLRNLKQLLPGTGFRSLGYAMLRTGVVPQRPVELSMNGKSGLQFELSFWPVAYDKQSGTITARDCSVESTENSPGGERSLLRTDTLFRGKEYTVLGATGSDPIFVVVHVEPVQ